LLYHIRCFVRVEFDLLIVGEEFGEDRHVLFLLFTNIGKFSVSLKKRANERGARQAIERKKDRSVREELWAV
jgi:hypothetical protein